MSIELPVEARQKFQVGTVCKIVEKGYMHEKMQYPKQPLDSFLQDRECVILGTYAQTYWGLNFADYSVYLLPRNENEYCGSFAWVEENQLEFVREPDDESTRILIEQDKKMLSYGGPYTSIFSHEAKEYRESNGLKLMVENLVKDGCFER